VLAALSTAHKLGLGLSALAFIVFALLSSMVIPRSNPSYPGRRLGWFVFVSILFFVGMMCAVFFFGKEAKPSEGGAAALVFHITR
jgi:NADH:ubiquinone oxidoreductase subunit 3 (subunit A)